MSRILFAGILHIALLYSSANPEKGKLNVNWVAEFDCVNI